MTLGWLIEAQHATFMLCQLSQLLVAKQWCLPTSLKSFREATASFVEYSSAPTRVNGFAVNCPPVSGEETSAMSRSPPGDLSGPEGWFRVFQEGSEIGRDVPGATAGGTIASTTDYGSAIVLSRGRRKGGEPNGTPTEYSWEVQNTENCTFSIVFVNKRCWVGSLCASNHRWRAFQHSHKDCWCYSELLLGILKLEAPLFNDG